MIVNAIPDMLNVNPLYATEADSLSSLLPLSLATI